MDIIQQIQNRQAQSRFPKRKTPPEHKPEMLYIGCSDARLAIDSDIGIPKGKAMIFRNISALVPKYSSNRRKLKIEHVAEDGNIPHDISVGAVLEFYINITPAIKGKTKQIVIAGHSNCGGIKACLASHKQSNQDLVLYLDGLSDACSKVNKLAKKQGWDETRTLRELEKEAIRQSVANLITYPVVKRALKEKTLQIHGWIIDTATHMIYEMDNETLEFNKMSVA